MRWLKRLWPGLAVIVLLGAIPAVDVLVPWNAGSTAAYPRLATWLASFALLLAVLLVIGKALTGLWRGVLVDERKRVSTSRLQFALWTALIISGYLSAVLANAAFHASDPLAISVPQTLWTAMAVSTASLAAAPLALRQGSTGRVATYSQPARSQWRDLVTGEEKETTGMVDVAKLQMVLVTFALVVAYGVVLGYSFYGGHARIAALPKVNDAFAILLAISHGGYIAKKLKA